MTSPLFKGPCYGGGGGSAWDDAQAAGTNPPTEFRRINLRSGTYLDQIESVYDNATRTHGGPGGSPATFDFVPNEILISVQGRSGAYVDQISFTTAVIYGGGDPPLIRTYGPFGGGGGAPFQIWGEIAAFYGRSGSFIDALGCYLATPTQGPFGGSGGSAFQDPGPILELTRIERITIRSGSYVDSIATTYRLPDGSAQTFSHGGAGGSAHDIFFNSDEHIIAVVGRSGVYLDNIAFLTEDRQGVRRTHGPFGGQGGAPFIVNANVNGFFGRSGSLIDSLGFFTS
ncbi:MAG TPA: jacalin-like lectin [Allosphingosinicella sp.]|nr:jacalin-like lectin [Allosphingosinicella sp.]